MNWGNTHAFRFGIFRFNPATGELLKGVTPLRLQEQPARVLAYLIERRGELVTRQELQNLLWPEGINVDYESGLNSTMRRLRQTLLDEADKPRYIETIPKRGYRWIAPVELESDATPINIPVLPPMEVSPATPRRRWIAIGALAAAATAIGVTALRRPRREPSVHTSIVIPPDQYLARLNGRSVAVSADGSQVAYVASTRGSNLLYRRGLTSGQTVAVADAVGAVSPTYSPGTNLLTWSGAAGITREANQQAQRLLKFDVGASVCSLGTSDDEDLIFSAPLAIAPDAPTGLTTRCMILPKGSTEARTIPIPYSGRGLETLIPQQWIDGRILLYNSVIGPQARSLWAIDTATGKRSELAPQATGGWLVEGDRLIYFFGGNLYLTQFDRANLKLTGEPRQVLSGVSNAGWTGPDAALSRDGTLVYVPERPYPDWRPVWVDLNGRKSPVPVPPGPFLVADLSPDGRYILLVRRLSTGLGTLLRYDLENGATVELARNVEWRACWGRGSSKVAFSDARSGEWLPTISVMDAESRQIEWRHKFTGIAQYPIHWASGDDSIYFVEGFHPVSQIDIYATPYSKPDVRTPVAVGNHSQTHPQVSPNSRYLAYSSSESGWLVHVRVLAGGSEIVIPRPNGGQCLAPMWAADNRTLYFKSGRAICASEISEQQGKLAATPPRILFEGDFVEPNQWDRNVFFDARRQRFLMALPEEEVEAPRRIDIITNWLSTLG